jgi:hypothetical protein
LKTESTMMIVIFQFYQEYGGPLVRPAIVLLALVGLWLGLSRAALDQKTRVVTWLVVAALLIAWNLAAIEVTRSGLYQEYILFMRPLGWIVALVVFIGLVRSRRIAAALEVVPRWWLVAFQVYRAPAGFVFLMLWNLGRAGNAGLPAGIGDALVGLLALPAAFYLASGRPGGRTAAIAWNCLGLADFALAFAVVSVISPTSGLGVAYPAAMIPAFLAPLSSVFHGLSLWQLVRAPGRLRVAPRSAS